MSFSVLSSPLCLAAACMALVGCTDDIALIDALPGTWRQANGELVTFTRSDSAVASDGTRYQGRVVARSGGIVDAIDGIGACRDAAEVGFLWAVEDLSLYGNMAFAVDPGYSSPNSSGACQATSAAFSYPVIETGARSFTIGTPEIEIFGIPAGPLETFTAEALFIDVSGLSDDATQLETLAVEHNVETGHLLDLRDVIRPRLESE
ncbi:MAG: hypothetical protein AB8H86_31535 [Polyangiales bacterium]